MGTLDKAQELTLNIQAAEGRNTASSSVIVPRRDWRQIRQPRIESKP